MLDILSRQRDIILPPPNVLHERSLVRTDLVLVNDQLVELPRFENDILSHPVDEPEEILFRDGRVAGMRHRFDTITDGGIDRGVSVYVPSPDIDSRFEFSVLLDTAWFTGLEGHNDRIAEIIMKELGVSVMLVGPEFTAFDPQSIGAETSLVGIADMSTGISLSLSAEASASIYGHLKELHPYLNLKDDIVDGGESRAAMIAQIRRIYLECFGVSSGASDLTDPNMAERAFMKFGDSLRLLKWPVRELIGAFAVGIDHALHGELKYMQGTIPLEKRYLTGAIIGTGPALFCGEESLGASYTSHDHPQHILNFKGSGAAHTSTRRENYKNHYNTAVIEKRGCHLSLGHTSVLSHFLARTLERGKTPSHVVRDNPELVQQIHEAKPSKYLKKRVDLQKAA